MQGLPRDIHKGMKVFDNTHAEIGVVEDYKFSDENPSQPGLEATEVNPGDRDRNNSLIQDIAEAFTSDDLPEEIRERLLNEGYVRIDADGLFAADRYVPASQIQSVSDDHVVLNVSKSELIKAH